LLSGYGLPTIFINSSANGCTGVLRRLHITATAVFWSGEKVKVGHQCFGIVHFSSARR